MAQNTCTEVESNDVEKVNRAIQARSQNDLSMARQLLEEVVANTPQYYVYSYEEGDRLFIRFWDQDEFIHYVTGLGAD